jgi:hypothetical protein
MVFNNNITESYLISSGFEDDGWGSPSFRETHDTKMWETFRTWHGKEWQICYFPPTFEGLVYPGTWFPVPMGGRIMMTLNSSEDNDYYISDMLGDVLDMEVFIRAVFCKKVDKFTALTYDAEKFKITL